MKWKQFNDYRLLKEQIFYEKYFAMIKWEIYIFPI